MTSSSRPSDLMLIRPADDAAIRAAAALLCQGQLVAFPTETVYGLGADAGNDHAVAAIFAAKGRPSVNPLIVHVEDAAQARRLARLDDRAERLIERFWPGPLTLVLPRLAASPLSRLVSAGLPTVALRAPAHPVARSLIAAAGRPIAAPSANLSGRLSPSLARHVAAGLDGRVAMLLDAGPCAFGIESTVIDLSSSEPLLLRPGGLASDAIEAVIGPLGSSAEMTGDATGNAPRRSPGLLTQHYAPTRPVRLNALAAAPGEAFLGFGTITAAAAPNLSPQGDVNEAAANLFAMLWDLDRPEFTGIAVAPIPETGLGQAINDRLRRAAAAPPPLPVAGDDWNDERGPAAPCCLPGDEDDDGSPSVLSSSSANPASSS